MAISVRLRLPIIAAIVIAVAVLPAAAAAATAPLGYDDARHLLARTGFGPTDAEVRSYATLTREAAVARLLGDVRTIAAMPPPASATDNTPLRPLSPATATEAERRAFVRQQVREGLELRAWWMQEMLTTPSPLTERMTLFWHNHFVSGQPKVRISRLMYRQNVTLRTHALGSFADLLHAMARDPAMLVYLDGARNRKGAPNENFAREVMELFTLGEGHYSEQDVKEAARAFTGWSVDRASGRFVYRPFLHDHGVKTLFGSSGRFDGDDVLDMLLARPETAERVTAKLWREFVSPDLDSVEVRRIAARFRESGYDIRVAVRAILTSDAFYATTNRAILVKSPVELVVGTLRELDLRPDRMLPFAIAAAGMGQNLLSPPNVKGWPGGDAWINTTTLLARKQFVDRVTRADDVPASLAMSAEGADTTRAERTDPGAAPDRDDGRGAAANGIADLDAARRQRFLRRMEQEASSVRFDSARWMAQFPGATPAEEYRWARRLLLPTEPQRNVEPAAGALAVVRAIVLDEAYQLK